jgi:glycosyltransferase involved in cell wall biosynthesis
MSEEIKENKNFDYFLHSMAKLGMAKGLFCYSVPQLINEITGEIKKNKSNKFLLFRFVKQHYRARWTLLLFLNLFFYEREIALLPFLSSLFYKRRILKRDLEKIEIKSTNKVCELETVDVIIPTIGRKQFLYDVLKDLSSQSYLPQNVIIVEQNPDIDSISELNFIYDEIWPFKIKHTFTHKAGACNARNIALLQVESEWIFMADDDIRFGDHFLEKAITKIKEYSINAVTFNCFQKNEKPMIKNVFQWSTFGSGCSIVKTEKLKNTTFDIRYEFGFGEDADFGMQIRNQGVDVVYLPEPSILHLKAPIGGFRTKLILPWHNEVIQPKPSPTVMLYKKMHLTEQQRNGYKTNLFFKFYKVQSIRNPIRYFGNFQKQWAQSLYWANELKNKK